MKEGPKVLPISNSNHLLLPKKLLPLTDKNLTEEPSDLIYLPQEPAVVAEEVASVEEIEVAPEAAPEDLEVAEEVASEVEIVVVSEEAAEAAPEEVTEVASEVEEEDTEVHNETPN